MVLSIIKDVILEECDGTDTITGNDPDILCEYSRMFYSDRKGKPTPLMTVRIYDIEVDTTFEQMFLLVGREFNSLYFTQHQIKQFCKDNKEMILNTKKKFVFLYKNQSKLSILYVDAGLTKHPFYKEYLYFTEVSLKSKAIRRALSFLIVAPK